MADGVLCFPATAAGCAHAAAELRALLDAQAIGDKPRYDVELVFEEIVSNVIRHGAVRSPECMIEVRVAFDDGAIVMRFEDDGRPFDPRDYDLPRLPQTLEEARVGGLGLLLVRRASARIDYERTRHDRNRTTITIPLPQAIAASGN